MSTASPGPAPYRGKLGNLTAWLSRALRGKSLAVAFDERSDNFLLLRFIAAVMVMYGHSYAFSGLPNHGDIIARSGWGRGIYSGSLAVDMFFVISGFLVTGSYLNRANLEVFLKSRALRIVPAYAACMLICAYVLGAVFTRLPLSTYWSSGDTFRYVYINVQFGTNLRWNLPGVFQHNFYPGAVDGSIWTLPAEVRMYAWVAILGALGILRRRWFANLVLFGLLLVGIFAPAHLPLVPKPVYLRLAAFFLSGAFCFVNRDWIPVSSVLMAILALLAVATHGTMLSTWTLGIALSYFCMWFAYVPNFHFFNRFGDYSYGIYLWGFPIQQAVSATIGKPVSPLHNLVTSLPIVILLAAVSWHFLEKPALRLKRVGNRQQRGARAG